MTDTIVSPTVVAAAVTAQAATPAVVTPPVVDPNANPALVVDPKAADPKADAVVDPNKDTKAVEPAKPVTVKAPNGTELPAETLAKFGELATTLKVSQEQAQEFVNWYAKEGQAKAQTQADAWKAVNDGWVAQAKSDAEIGGDKFDNTVANAKRAAAKFGDEKFIEALNITGMGNHPAMIKFLNKVAIGFGEDKTIQAPGVNPNRADDIASRLFPNQAK